MSTSSNVARAIKVRIPKRHIKSDSIDKRQKCRIPNNSTTRNQIAPQNQVATKFSSSAKQNPPKILSNKEHYFIQVTSGGSICSCHKLFSFELLLYDQV